MTQFWLQLDAERMKNVDEDSARSGNAFRKYSRKVAMFARQCGY